MSKDWKDRLGVVFSTSDNYDFDYDDQEEEDTLDPKDQRLYVYADRKQRKGKAVTIVEGFVGLEDDLKELGKTLKTKCGTGGSVKDGEIIIQGDNKKKVYDILIAMGYSVKMKG
jgi:translation initiation factor 1